MAIKDSIPFDTPSNCRTTYAVTLPAVTSSSLPPKQTQDFTTRLRLDPDRMHALSTRTGAS